MKKEKLLQKHASLTGSVSQKSQDLKKILSEIKTLKEKEQHFVNELERNTKILHGGTPAAISITSDAFDGEQGEELFRQWARSFPIHSETSPLVHALEETIQALVPFTDFKKAREFALMNRAERIAKFSSKL